MAAFGRGTRVRGAPIYGTEGCAEELRDANGAARGARVRLEPSQDMMQAGIIVQQRRARADGCPGLGNKGLATPGCRGRCSAVLAGIAGKPRKPVASRSAATSCAVP